MAGASGGFDVSIWPLSAKATIEWPTNFSVLPGGKYEIFGSADGNGGDIDYDTPLIKRRIEPWPDVFPGGFGVGDFGAGAFGYGYYGFGFGEGDFGYGPFGFGCHMLKRTTGKLADGLWQFVVVGYDEVGNADVQAERVEDALSLAGVPEPPTTPQLAWADGVLTISYTKSTDDEG